MYKDSEKQKAFQRDWQRKQRLERKKKAVALLGSKCKRCGYDENIFALQIDHIEPQKLPRKNKESAWNGLRTISLLARGLITTKGLQLLCANCHCIKTHEEDRQKFKGYIK